MSEAEKSAVQCPTCGQRTDNPLPEELRTSPEKCAEWLARFAHRPNAHEALAKLLDLTVGQTLLEVAKKKAEHQMDYPLPIKSPFSIREEQPGMFRVYVYHVGLFPTGDRADAERLLRSLEHERAKTNEAANREMQDLRDLLARGLELFGGTSTVGSNEHIVEAVRKLWASSFTESPYVLRDQVIDAIRACAPRVGYSLPAVKTAPARASENAPQWVRERGNDMCRCCCRRCAEGDHCAGGRQIGLGDCLYPERDSDSPPNGGSNG